MKSSADYKVGTQFALLLQGPAKSGKTSLILQHFPKPYLIDADRNINGAMKVFADLRAAGKIPKTREAMYDNLDCVEEFGKWDQLCNFCREAIKDPKIETIAIDSLTTVSPILISHILRKSPPKCNLAGEPMMEIQHWQPFQTLMQRLVMMLRASGKKFVFVCHEEVIKDEMSGILQYKINMPSRLQHSFGALFTDCWRLESVENPKGFESKLRVMSSTRVTGLGNTLGLPPELNPQVSPEFEKAMKSLGGVS